MEEKKEVLKLLSYAYRYLSYRMRTEKEMELYLLEKSKLKHISEKFIHEAILHLVEHGYLNDNLFVEEYILSRNKSKPKSKYVLSIELAQKGIKSEIINSYFEHNKLDEETLAKRAVYRRWQSFRLLKQEKRHEKTTNFLRRRGFSFGVIKKTIEELESSE